MNETDLQKLSLKIRRKIIEAAYNAKQGAHIGGALSMAEILAVLYGKIMCFDANNPGADGRDRFILSKGHDCLGLYAVLNAIGVISDEELAENYQTDGGFLTAHTTKNVDKGIECTSGSLGMGLSFGIGKALAAKIDGKDYKTFAVAGDGECNEGEVWEASAMANQCKLGNLVLIIDRNRFQLDGSTEEIMDVDIAEAFKGFGWNVYKTDGHNVTEIETALKEALNSKNDIPSVIIADTVKGKGISFMENDNTWHHHHLTEQQYLDAMKELDCD